MGIFDMDILMYMTRRELEVAMVGHSLAELDRRDSMIEQARLIGLAFSTKPKWKDVYDANTKQRISALGGKHDMDSRELDDALVNARLTEMINRKDDVDEGVDMFDDMERKFHDKNNPSIDKEE